MITETVVGEKIFDSVRRWIVWTSCAGGLRPVQAMQASHQV